MGIVKMQDSQVSKKREGLTDLRETMPRMTIAQIGCVLSVHEQTMHQKFSNIQPSSSMAIKTNYENYGVT